MKHAAALALLCLSSTAFADEPFVPAAAAAIPGYSAARFPCHVVENGGRDDVRCETPIFIKKTLRELSILRNTIYARYGWDGYRKPWLRDYFHKQPWFKPNPGFSYKLLTVEDRANAHFVAVVEQTMTEDELAGRKDELLARYGKIFDDKPEWNLKDGKTIKSCKKPKNTTDDLDAEQATDGSRDCKFAKESWYKADAGFTIARLSTDDKVELGLLSRAMGSFALDDDTRGKEENGLDGLLKVDELRQLSLRDLRILRNTIYARRGRTFKSKVLQDHFGGMDWYKPAPAYTDKLLTKNDARNISLIKSVENEFGGPLKDEDWLAEPATDGA